MNDDQKPNMMADARTRTERALERIGEELHSIVLELRVGKVPDSLAAIHDLLDERFPTKGDPCPCGCKNAEDDPEPESVTVSLPRDLAQWSAEAWAKHPEGASHYGFTPEQDAVLHAYGKAVADALDAADGSQS